MKLYASKVPACQAQYQAIFREAESMKAMTIQQLHDRYHDGVGLPPSSKYCYLGRSQVVHPAMNLVRIKGLYSQDVKEQILSDFEEVVEHLARLQRRLDNPPQ